MAAALIGGMLQQGFPAANLRVIDLSAPARDRFAGLGVGATEQWVDDPGQDQPPADVVVFAVKPQNMKAAVSGVKSQCAGALVVSIAAGIRCADIARWLGGHERIVRVMPNTPALIGEGVSGLFATPGVGADDRQAANVIVTAAGKSVWLEDEVQLDAVTAVSGSGPGYVFYFIEALEAAATKLGLEAKAARLLAIETFRGAAQLAATSEDSPAQLRAKVTSRGGTTQQALAAMESSEVSALIVQAVEQAAQRAREMGDEFGDD